MPKGSRAAGAYIGSIGSYGSGGKFSLVSSQLLKSMDSWPGILPNGLQLHLDATYYSGSGSAWADRSGNQRNFNWSPQASFTPGVIPYFNTNGYGATGPASDSFGITNTSGYTIFVVASQNSLVATQSFQFYSTNAGTTRGIFSHGTWSDGNIYFDQGGCCDANTRTSVAMTSPNTGAWKVIGYRCNAVNERSIWQNGVNSISNTTAPVAINLSSTPVSLATGDGYGPTWDAKISQFVVYNRALSDGEMVSVTNSLKAKVGL